jgi:hypothetical protein
MVWSCGPPLHRRRRRRPERAERRRAGQVHPAVPGLRRCLRRHRRGHQPPDRVRRRRHQAAAGGLRGDLQELRRRVRAARPDARTLPGLRRGLPALRAGLPGAPGRHELGDRRSRCRWRRTRDRCQEHPDARRSARFRACRLAASDLPHHPGDRRGSPCVGEVVAPPSPPSSSRRRSWRCALPAASCLASSTSSGAPTSKVRRPDAWPTPSMAARSAASSVSSRRRDHEPASGSQTARRPRRAPAT